MGTLPLCATILPTDAVPLMRPWPAWITLPMPHDPSTSITTVATLHNVRPCSTPSLSSGRPESRAATQLPRKNEMMPLRTIQIAAPKPNPIPIASMSLASAMLTPMAEPSKNNTQLAVITKNRPAMMAPQLIKDRQREITKKQTTETKTKPPCVKQKKRLPSPWHDIKNEQGLYHGKRTEKRSRADLASTVRVKDGIANAVI